jgi:hypothetical protein
MAKVGRGLRESKLTQANQVASFLSEKTKDLEECSLLTCIQLTLKMSAYTLCLLLKAKYPRLHETKLFRYL